MRDNLFFNLMIIFALLGVSWLVALIRWRRMGETVVLDKDKLGSYITLMIGVVILFLLTVYVWDSNGY